MLLHRMALVFFGLLRKNFGNFREFFAQMVYRFLRPPRPPPGKKIARTPMRHCKITKTRAQVHNF